MRRDISIHNPVIRKLIEWAQAREDVRAAILTSSLTNPDAPVDLFSDYDIIYAVRDVFPYHRDDAWLEDFGRVLVVYRDPLSNSYGFPRFARITQYEDGTKIDFTIIQADAIVHIASLPELPADLDVGYKVLLDNDGLTTGLKLPTFQAYIPAPPPEAEYLRVVEEFFHEATYSAKHLWRGDLMPAKYNLDEMMKQDNLRNMLEWHFEIDAGWTIKPGAYGRGLRRWLRPEIHAALEETYTGGGIEENWTALFRTIDLFRQVACEVGQKLGYAYPSDLDQRLVAYLEKVRRLPPDARSFE